MAGSVRLTKQAVRDLDRLGPEGRRVAKRLEDLGRVPRPANLDVKPLRGREPWSRARVGTFRVILRPLTAADIRAPGASARGVLVYRIVHRRDLERVVARL